MMGVALSFRASAELAEQTRQMADALGVTSADYMREAVREKNGRWLKERMVFLSKRLGESNLVEGVATSSSAPDL